MLVARNKLTGAVYILDDEDAVEDVFFDDEGTFELACRCNERKTNMFVHPFSARRSEAPAFKCSYHPKSRHYPIAALSR
jgi:hypothetical protein